MVAAAVMRSHAGAPRKASPTLNTPASTAPRKRATSANA
jgi:hypothetical protein